MGECLVEGGAANQGATDGGDHGFECRGVHRLAVNGPGGPGGPKYGGGGPKGGGHLRGMDQPMPTDLRVS